VFFTALTKQIAYDSDTAATANCNTTAVMQLMEGLYIYG